MISALGYCEDPVCSQASSSHELVRLFRCSIHCDRLLCLFHLNAHNVYYEEEKKQNDAVLNELQNCLTLYQTIFEQHIQAYRELVHQASTLILHNTSSIIPIEQIRPVLEKLQRSIAIFQQDNVIIKSELNLDVTEFDIDLNLSIKKEVSSPPVESARTVVVRLERIDFNKDIRLNDEQINKNQMDSSKEDEIMIESIGSIHDEDVSKARKLPVEVQQDNKRPRCSTPISSGKTIKKKPVALKRLQA